MRALPLVSIPRSRLPLIGLILLLLVAGVVALAPALLGHPSAEIEFQILNPSPVSTCTNEFCSAACPVDYYAIGGKCATNSPGVPVWNLLGILPSQQSWDCFLDSYAGSPSTVTAQATCLKVGDWQLKPFQFCGNYKIEPSTGAPGSVTEVCDASNLNGLDCTNFFSSDGVQLCNGNLSCTSSCDAFDASACKYCSQGTCPIGTIQCMDNTCAKNCNGNGGPKSPSGTDAGSGGGSCVPFVSCPGIPPAGGGGGPPTPFCGDLMVNVITEACDPPSGGAGSPSCGAACFTCPDGSSYYVYGTCTASCGCTSPVNPCGPSGPVAGNCPNGMVDAGEQCDGDSFACELGFGSPADGTHYECTNSCQCVSVPGVGGGAGMCGNGTVDAGETCDGSTSTCGPITGVGAKWTCVDCQCTGQVCGNGTQEGDEQCDGDASVCASGPVTGGNYICQDCECNFLPIFGGGDVGGGVHNGG